MVDKLRRIFLKRFHWFVPFWYGLSVRLTRKRGVVIPKYDNFYQIAYVLSRGVWWRKDPLNGILDTMSHPTKTHVLGIKRSPKIGDCEDHSVYWVVAALHSGLVDEAWLGTVQYRRKDGKPGGHVIYIFKIGGEWYCGDYSEPSRISDEWAWVPWYTDKAVAAGMWKMSVGKNFTPKFGKYQYKLY